MKRLFWVMGLGLLGNILGAWLMGQDVFRGDRLRGYGILPNPILLSSVAVIQIAIGLQLPLTTLREKIATIAMLGATTTIVSLSVSRGPTLTLQAVLLVWMIYTPYIKTSHKIAIATIAATTAATTACIFAYTTNLIEVLTARGISHRPIIWEEAISYAHQHLLFGWGWLNDFSQSVGKHGLLEHIGNTILHPHSLLVSALFYGGIIGLLVHVIFLGFCAHEAVKSKMRGLTLSLLAAVLLLTAADTHAAVARRDFMLLIFWLPTALIIMTNLPTRPEKGRKHKHNNFTTS